LGLQRVRFFAGHALEDPSGQRVGALSIMNIQPRALSAADNDLLRDLAQWVQKEPASEEELVRANQVQRSLLPKVAPVVPGYEVAGRCLPARDLAGDFFDYFMVGDELQVSVADVMGKGVAAAIIGASVRAVLRGATRFIGVMEAVNRVAIDLAPDLSDTSSFVTLFSARLEPGSGRLTYVDAGHGLSGIIGPDGEVRRLGSDDLPLGALDGSTWIEQTATINVGDTFVSVSDGLLDYFETMGEASTAVVRSAVAATSAEDLIERISNYSLVT
jgi:serine phosphatase RsbU (regulator of sigma subunit)